MRTAKTTTRNNAEYLSEAERLVACFEQIVDSHLDRVPQRAEVELKKALATFRHPSKVIAPLEIKEVCAAWRAMQARWDKVPVGETVRVEWHPARSRVGHSPR